MLTIKIFNDMDGLGEFLIVEGMAVRASKMAAQPAMTEKPFLKAHRGGEMVCFNE